MKLTIHFDFSLVLIFFGQKKLFLLTCFTSSLNNCHSTVAKNSLVGRTRLQILQRQLQTLHNNASFRWADIGRILGILERTLHRRRHEFGLPVGVGENLSDVSNDDLVREILEVTPSAGQRLAVGGLRQRGL